MRKLGLGLDFQHRNQYPGSLSGLISNFSDQLSHLSIVAVEDEKQAMDFLAMCPDGLPIVHHLSSVAPAGIEGPNNARLEQLERVGQALDAIWATEDIGLWHIGPHAIPYFTPPVFELEVAEVVGLRIEAMQHKMSVTFHAEIPSCTLTVGQCEIGRFFEVLTRVGGCKMLLDVSHVYSYALANDLDPVSVLQSLPLDRVQEAHIAGGTVLPEQSSRYIDSHSHDIMPEVADLLRHAVHTCPDLRAVTFELGSRLSLEQITRNFQMVEELLDKEGWTPRLKDRQECH